LQGIRKAAYLNALWLYEPVDADSKAAATALIAQIALHPSRPVLPNGIDLPWPVGP
jgi:hypothetical protein